MRSLFIPVFVAGVAVSVGASRASVDLQGRSEATTFRGKSHSEQFTILMAGADGGNGTSNGMPGCNGGTNPAPDGKFYIPGTKKQCNPGKQDREKLKQK